MAAHCCTAEIMKRWGWVSFGEKLGESMHTKWWIT